MSRQDNSSKIVDPFLLKVIEQHRGQPGFTDILRSIQEEQNEIVDCDFGENIVVQGCAGSGKTMILFHRLANILYNLESMPGKVIPGRIAVIIPNDEFREYIKSLTWSLGVDEIRTYTMDEYLLSKVTSIMNKIFKSEASDTVSGNGGRSETSVYDFMQEARADLAGNTSGSKQPVLKKDAIRGLFDFITEYEETHRQMVTKRNAEREQRLERKRPSSDSSYKDWLKKSLDEIRKYREEMMKRFKMEFLDGRLNRDYMLGLLEETCKNEGLRDYRPNADDLVLIDEGQDYGYAEYATLKTVSPDCIYNIYGDIDQKIFERGIEKWDRILELFKARYFELNQDYRNSNQVVEFVNKSFNKNILSVGFSTKDVEEVSSEKLPVYLEYESKLLKHRIAIVSEQPWIYRDIPASVKVLTVKQIKGLEFDTVFVSPELSDKSDNYRYISYTRALEHLYLLE